MYYVGECLRLTVHFRTILAHSDQPTTPTSEVNVLELIGKFEEFFVKQGTDFDLKMHSFGPLAVNAIMSCFRDFVSGKVGETEQVKSSSSYITEAPTAKVPKSDTSKYSGFWENRERRVGHWAEVLLDMFQTYNKTGKRKLVYLQIYAVMNF